MTRISEFVSAETDGEFQRSRESSCTYCGDTSAKMTRDHVIPVSWVGNGRSYSRGDTVPCCAECNSTLGSVAVFNIPDRAKYLYGQYSSKWLKSFRFPEWSDYELEDMDVNLANEIRGMIRLAKYRKARVNHLVHVASGDIDEPKVKQISLGDNVITRILTTYVGMSGKESDVVQDIADGLILDIKMVRGVLSENKKYHKAIAEWKWSLGLPLDCSVKSLRA